MTRYIRNTVIAAAVEDVSGVDQAPTAAANAVLVSEVSITPLDAQNIQRKNLKGYFGGDEQLVGPASVKCSFTVELAGSGAAATPPALGTLLRGCAIAESSLTTPNRTEYTPISTGLETLTIYYYDDGVLHKLIGAMGNATLSAKVGERAVLKFDFVGIDGGISADTPGTIDLTAWKKPVAMTKANVVDATWGCTYAAGALSGGTVYPSTGLEIMLGNAVSFTPMLSKETVDITDRDVTGRIQHELTAAQEVSFMADVKANTTAALGMVIGTASGNKCVLHFPKVQKLNPKKEDLNAKRVIGYDLRVIPNTGNDEFRFAFT